MHVALTDRIFCPRCGPEFGLILFAEEVRDRRVLEGELGCFECREKYPIRGGFADLRARPRGHLAGSSGRTDGKANDPEGTLRLGALLGITEGPGTILIEGPEAGRAKALAEMVVGVEVVAMDPNLEDEEETPGVSRVVVPDRLPFFTATFKGIVLSGASPNRLLKEAARVLAPGCRLALLGPSSVSQEDLKALGLAVLLEEGEVLVTKKDGSGSLPLITLRGP